MLSSLSSKGDVLHILTPPSRSLYEQAIEEAALHFKVVELVEKKEVTELRFSIPKDSSVEQLKESEINSIIADIFWREGSCQGIGPLEQSHSVYLIKLRSRDTYEDKEFDSVFNFYRSVLPGHKDFLIKPKNWGFTDNLKDSVALRYFLTRCTKVYLWVDNDLNMVNYIHLKIL